LGVSYPAVKSVPRLSLVDPMAAFTWRISPPQN
jgi:hypothetical protein